MTRQVNLDEEEALELELLLRQDLAASRVELRHTWRADYKRQVKQHIHVVERMLSQVAAEQPAQAGMSAMM